MGTRMISRASVFTAALLTTLASAAAARAQAPAKVMSDGMHDYFDSEKGAAIAVLGSGLVSVGAGSFLVTRESHFARGLGVPILALGAVQTFAGMFYHSTLDGRIAKYDEQIKGDPAGYKLAESQRMEGVIRRFRLFKWTEVGVFAVGAGLTIGGFAKKDDTLEGVGIGVGIEALYFLALDLFADHGAHVYAKKLADFPVGFNVQPGQGPVRTASFMTWGGAF